MGLYTPSLLVRIPLPLSNLCITQMLREKLTAHPEPVEGCAGEYQPQWAGSTWQIVCRRTLRQAQDERAESYAKVPLRERTLTQGDVRS